MRDWRAAISRHHARVGTYADAFVRRRSIGAKHPVHDFLFTYYSFAPAKLKQWLPPPGVWLENVTEADVSDFPWLASTKMKRDGGRIALDEAKLDARTAGAASWIAGLCRSILDRPPRFRCFGMHEWAMVYQQPAEELRHRGWRLRLPAAELSRFVESQPLCCTHYDAFRFFTPQARLLNTFAPTLDSRIDLEQGACLHANMDLYKWATKLWPWIGADLVADTFLLALAGRDLDMRASPYDLRDLGCEPVRVETPEGRERYEAEQRDLAARARPLREKLMQAALDIAKTAATRAPTS